MDTRQAAAQQAPIYHTQVFTPLVKKCKELNRAIRIGTNHGSLSARILSFYGDTPKCVGPPALKPLHPSCAWRLRFGHITHASLNGSFIRHHGAFFVGHTGDAFCAYA